MSTDYFLVCETHQMACHITDNKGNPPMDSDLLVEFIEQHSPGLGCKVVFLPDFHVDLDWFDAFKAHCRWSRETRKATGWHEES